MSPLFALAVLIAQPSLSDAPQLSPTPRTTPVDPATLFLRAGAAYDASRFDEAAELYAQVIKSGVDNGHLWYNLGNSYLRAGALGDAVAAYLKARSLLPRDQDVHANLEFARQSSKDAVTPPAPAPVLSTLLFWHYRLSRHELLWLLAIANALFWGALSLSSLRREAELWRWLAAGAAVVWVAAGASFAVHAMAPQQVAVVRQPEVSVNAGIGEESVLRFKLHAGSEVRWLERRDNWLRVTLPDGTQGWVDERSVVALAL